MHKHRSALVRVLVAVLVALFLVPETLGSEAHARKRKRCYYKKFCKYKGRKKKRCYRVKVRKCKWKRGRKKCRYKWKKRCHWVRKKKCKYKKVCYRRRR